MCRCLINVLFVPESPVKSPGRIDFAGAALLSAGLICLLLALSEGDRWGWASPEIIGLFSAAAILIPQFVQTPERAGYGFGVDVTGAGLFMLPSAAIMLVAGPFAGMLAGRVGSKLPLMLGTGFAAASFGMLSIAHSQEWHVGTQRHARKRSGDTCGPRRRS